MKTRVLMALFGFILFLTGLVASSFIPVFAYDEDGNSTWYLVKSDNELQNEITLQVEPKQLKYEDSFTINATTPDYQTNDRWYFISIIDPNGKEIFSTEWYTYAPFVFQMWTGSSHSEFYVNGTYRVIIQLAGHDIEKRVESIIKEEFFTVTGIPDRLADEPKEHNATGRSLSAFGFEIDDYYLDGRHAYFVAEPGTKSTMPITIKNKSQSYVFAFHPTFGNQKNPPPLPDGVNIWFEPNYLSLEPHEERTIDLVIDLNDKVNPTVYDVGIVGFWEEPNGFVGSSIRLHVGDYFGSRALPINFELPSPLAFYKESGGRTDIVECKGNKILLIKESNGHPACVTFGSVAKLVDRSWAKSDMQFLNVVDLKPVYYSDEKISFGVHKIGLVNCDWITFKIFDQNDVDKNNILLEDTAERICLKEIRDSSSLEKSWKLYAEFPQNDIEPIILDPGNYLMQILSDGAVTIEREFRVIERTMMQNEN